jgi:hypothetical protein
MILKSTTPIYANLERKVGYEEQDKRIHDKVKTTSSVLFR